MGNIGIPKNSPRIIKEISDTTSEFVKGAVIQAMKLGFDLDTEVSRKGSNDSGVVIGYNDSGSRSNLYPSDRYPIVVEWKDKSIFEYNPHDLIIIER